MIIGIIIVCAVICLIFSVVQHERELFIEKGSKFAALLSIAFATAWTTAILSTLVMAFLKFAKWAWN